MLKQVVLSLVVPFPFLSQSGVIPKKEVLRKKKTVLFIGNIGPDSPEAAEKLRKILNKKFNIQARSSV